MSASKLAEFAVIATGVLGLVYGGFSSPKAPQEAKIGSIELSATDRQTVNVPVWAAVGAVVTGGALLLLDGKTG